MRIIELCAGYGGLGLGVKIAVPSARVVCAVEREAYTVARWQELVEAQAVEPVAFWPDVESFAWAMATRNRKRLGLQLLECDMLTAGFPCQPFSQAGKRRGVADERWIWPAIRRAIGVLGPHYVFLENVAGILNAGGFGRVLGDLATLGFDAEWDCIPAADAGANHFRFRVFIFAWRRDDANAGSIAGRAGLRAGKSRRKRRGQRGDIRSAADAEHALCERCGGQPKHQGEQAAERGRDAERRGAGAVVPPSPRDDGHTPGERLEERSGLRPRRQTADTATEAPERRHVGPAPGGVDDGATEELGQGWWNDCPYPPEQWLSRDEPDRAEQLHALGNGVVPLQAALALTLLARRAGVTL